MNKLNFYQFGRALLPKCSSDAKIFSSDVYKESTQARKYQADGLQYGRSMIEMLGVLAIVGVLSVGAIAGYQKAMFKYKLNKHSVAINTLLNTAIQYTNKLTSDADEKDDAGTIVYTNTFHRAGFTPDGIKPHTTSSNYLIDIFGNYIWLFQAPTYSGMGYSFAPDVLEKEICKNLINIVKQNSSEIYYINTDQNDVDNEYTVLGKVYGDKYCTDKCLRDISLNDIDTLCNSCSSGNCRFYVMWK